MAVATNSPDKNQYFTLQARTMTGRSDNTPGEEENWHHLYTDDDPIFAESYHNSILEDIIEDGSSLKGIKHLDFLLFSNKRFRDNSYTLDFSITEYYDILTTFNHDTDPGEGIYNPLNQTATKVVNLPVEVLFTAISPELYPFFKIKDHDPDSEIIGYIMFSEPGLTYSNVHNGIGIVGAVSGTKVVIDIPPFPGGRERIPKWE